MSKSACSFLFLPNKTSTTVSTSRELPIDELSGSSMFVISALVLQLDAFETDTKLLANFFACLILVISAPLPTLTSRIRLFIPDANFFEIIDAVIKSTESTVQVTSLVE